MKRFHLFGRFAALVVAAICLGWYTAPPSEGSVFHPLIPAKGSFPTSATSTSTNWAGYSVSTSKHEVTDVSANWVVPTAKKCKTDRAAAVWVGIDGATSNTVEQIGTDSDCNGSKAKYYAWWEMYPDPSHKFSTFSIHAGDFMFGEVHYDGSNKFTLTLANLTTGKTKTKTKTATANRDSAEWIVEAPSNSSGIQPLTNFGKVSMSSGYATISGTNNTIGSFTYSKIDMETSGGVTKASTSGLTGLGDEFTVTWQHK